MSKNGSFTMTEKDTGWKGIKKSLKQSASMTLDAGFPKAKAPADIAMRAAVNEYGEHARPFLSPTIDANRKRYAMLIATAAATAACTGRSPKRELEKVGDVMVEDIKRAITTMSSPRNAASTVAKKGKDDPLVASGEMRGAVTYEINGGKL